MVGPEVTLSAELASLSISAPAAAFLGRTLGSAAAAYREGSAAAGYRETGEVRRYDAELQRIGTEHDLARTRGQAIGNVVRGSMTQIAETQDHIDHLVASGGLRGASYAAAMDQFAVLSSALAQNTAHFTRAILRSP